MLNEIEMINHFLLVEALGAVRELRWFNIVKKAWKLLARSDIKSSLLRFPSIHCTAVTDIDFDAHRLKDLALLA